ncbi:hypothetical protein MCOR25_009290 [Pyricularia grisea]|uniref:tetrahydrofolate synthase n=1 Tax=Pyricularia grisea TaxID=148305 RepID=A0A6P8BDS1_PYRGI|nr:uncharacterized protein PgNI_04119 [Pyricularia grisea]KAI6352796.1 hypothetical protein MCOR25_009290 [Pyricularia grisea]TLD13963.1 hypothetical protein PgNI_04119 [Pyricularia grisea]
MSKSYQEALRLLTSRSRAFRKVITDAGGKPRPPRGNDVGMREWLTALGHDRTKTPFDVIHVTGTKGKGGTCAWTDALLRAHLKSRAAGPRAAVGSQQQQQQQKLKVGLYTSPHIVSERERIRIDFAPVSEDTFARHFFDVWNALLNHVGGGVDDMPGYLQLLALLSVQIFRNEGVAVAIYEVHAGGRFDATSLWDRPVACGFNTIGLDHVGLLGNNVSEIAWNKAGIMRKGTTAISVPQIPEAREQLEAEAKLLNCPLTFIDQADEQTIPSEAGQIRSELLLPGPRYNLALATRLANTYLEARLGSKLGKEDILQAIHDYQWPGRFQVVQVPGQQIRWYLDLAHNDLSLPVALNWFFTEASKFDKAQPGQSSQSAATSKVDISSQSVPRTKVLIFGHQSHFRETAPMAETVVRHCNAHGLDFDHVILASHSHRVSGKQVFGYDSALEIMEIWKGMAGSPEVTWSASIAEAIETANQIGPRVPGEAVGAHCLIVGSSHLISSAISAMPSPRPSD